MHIECDTVKQNTPKMDTELMLCKSDIISAMKKPVNIVSVNQHHKISIKCFIVEFWYGYGINKDIEYNKYMIMYQ